MKTVVLDTNVLLDLFIFNDFRALHLKQDLSEGNLHAIACAQTLAEFADVISRPLFNLEPSTQERCITEWCSFAHIVDDAQIVRAPWKCEDEDDQIFLDLAYTSRPCILLSKDNALLHLAKRALPEGILISADYTAL